MSRTRRAPRRRTPLAPGAFVDRVMAAVRLETPPTPTRALLGALRDRSLGDAAASLAVAWHLATVSAWRVAPSVRARSLALVLAVTLALFSGSLVAASAIRFASDPVTRLFQAQVDDHGPLRLPAAVIAPGNVDPDALDGEDAAGPTGDAARGDDPGAAGQADSDDPEGSADGNDGDAAEAATDDDQAEDAGEAADEDADEVDEVESEPEDEVDEADTDAADSHDTDMDEADIDEPDEPDTDEAEPDESETVDGGDSSDDDGASDDSGHGSGSDD